MKKRYWGLYILLMIGVGCGRNPKEPGLELMPDMVRAVPYEAFSQNPNTADGKTLMLPPEGSVPRGFTPYHYGETPEEAERAGRELVNPLEYTEAHLKSGKVLYETYCLTCHGNEGKGDGPLIPKFPNPPSFRTQPVKNYSEGRIFHIVTRGSGMMQSHASQIRPEDRWKIAMYVKSLSGGGQ